MENNPLNMTPIDWFNFYGDFGSIFIGLRAYNMITPFEAALMHPSEPNLNDLNKTTFYLDAATHLITVSKQNKYNFPPTAIISKFMLLSAIKFGSNHVAAISFVAYELMGINIPYIRVGVDYFKIIKKQTRYGGWHTQAKRWKKDEIKEDHSKSFIQQIPKYDDFIIVPDNKSYKSVINNCYNLYSKFEHKPAESCLAEEIPTILNFLRHIFQDHFELGLIYMKVLYEFPTQILPILVLLSEDNETGKTTFINFLEMIFGDNYVLISPEMLVKEFNLSYATKNIIAMEEAFVEKQMGVEKLKSLSTGKSINISRKFIDDNSMPFYGKIIMCTNKVKDFMKINSKEIRFWLREVPSIPGEKNRNIETDMFNEIPKFLRYLLNLPPIMFNKQSRMVFSADQLETMALKMVKEESKSWLFKELEILIHDFFETHPQIPHFYASLKDIKDLWFERNNNATVTFLKKVLQDECNIKPVLSDTGKSVKYYAFDDRVNPHSYKTGTPYYFERQVKVETAITWLVE